MPKIPDDMEACARRTEKDRKAMKAVKREMAKSTAPRISENDEAVIRGFANDLRAKQGLPPLQPDEPVVVFFCSRRRK